MSTVPMKPICFILMPFSRKIDAASGLTIDFDEIYEEGIRPGIEAAGMEPIRADEERTGGIIHKAMFERLILCDYAVADLTTGNANVFYELGVRHAARPATTLAIFATDQKIPFDLNFLRALPYRLGEGGRLGTEEAGALRTALTRRLQELKREHDRQETRDSPLFQLLTDYRMPDISRLKTDIFREQVEYAVAIKQRLARARDERRPPAVHEVEQSLGADLGGVEAGVLVDLFLSYRAVQDWGAMIDLHERLPAALKRTTLIREQLGFALNRLGRRAEALAVLEGVLGEQGPSSETCGLIGRIYKDQWTEASQRGETRLATGFLDKAIAMYRQGFEADIRDAYPGINLVTLLEIKGDPDSLAEQADLLPVVRFAVRRRLKTVRPDYWDLATLLELAVLADRQSEVDRCLTDALVAVREPWEPLTTANNLKMIREARAARGIDVTWVSEGIEALERAGHTTRA